MRLHPRIVLPFVLLSFAAAAAAAQEIVPMPFASGVKVRVAQGFHSALSHKGADVFAVDIPVPEGTTILAVRSGRVWSVKEDSSTGCASNSCAPHANYLLVDHGDGTFARYVHLQYRGALVGEGDLVCAGQPIARSGNTGYSTTPHLHFQMNDLFQQSVRFKLATASGVRTPYPGGSYTSSTPVATACAEQQHLQCPPDAFAHAGVFLDGGAPCGVAPAGRSYTISGVSSAVAPRVKVTRWAPGLSGESTCVPVGAGGRFSASLYWSPARYHGLAYWKISPARSDCSVLQDWDTPYRIQVR